jgi:hypothetical protein
MRNEVKCPEGLKPSVSNDGDFSTTYLYLQENENKGKTRKWTVWNKMHGTDIGRIKWSTSFRKYAFFPYADTMYEQVCLREIADFIEYMTALHKQKRKQEKNRG